MLISYKKPKGRFFIVGKPGGSPAVTRHISINVSNGLGTLYIDGNAVTLDADNTWEADIPDGTQITMQMSVDSDHEMCCWYDLNGNIPEWQDDYGTHYGSTATITVSGDYAIGTQIDTYYNLTVVVDPTKYTIKVYDTVYSTDYHGRNTSGNCDKLACIPEAGYQFNGWGTTTVDGDGYWCYPSDEVITPDVTAVAPVQPNDEIWYTSTDGNIVTPNSADFGTGITVASNTYADGKGVIKLSGDATTIGQEAFKSCTKLATIDIPNGVTSIGNYAFDSCSGLTSINIPNSVTSVGLGVFYHCSNLTTVNIPNGVTKIGTSFFNGCSNLTTVNIPNSVTRFGDYAFKECTNLTTIDIPDGVTYIGYNVFENCLSLTTVNIPNGVTKIEYSAFQGCSNLTTVNIPNSVTLIDTNAFYNCISLASVTIPSSVTKINNRAFYGCGGLTSITWEATTPPTLGNSVFNNTNNCPIYVPAASVTAYQGASGWSTYSSRIQAIP